MDIYPILKYAYQFLDADKYIIASPLWNLGIPAILKAYIDYICITGITFKYTSVGINYKDLDKESMHIQNFEHDKLTKALEQYISKI